MRDNLIRMNRVGFTPALFYYNKPTREACRRLFNKLAREACRRLFNKLAREACVPRGGQG